MASDNSVNGRSESASIGAESTKCLTACSCDKCQVSSNLSSKSSSENHSESKSIECGLLQKQKEEVNESDNSCIDDKSRSGSQGDHSVDIVIASGITTQNQLDQTHQVQGGGIGLLQIIANAIMEVIGSWVKFFYRLIDMVGEICLAFVYCIVGERTPRRRWKNLVFLKKTARRWRVFVKNEESSLAVDENRSRLLNEEHNSPQSDHAVDIPRDVYSKMLAHYKFNSDSFNGACFARLVVSILNKTIEIVRSWVFWKWVIRLVNVVIELLQAIITQEHGRNRISDCWYMTAAVILSIICLGIALVEIMGEAKRSKVKWRRDGYCCWFYYPEGHLFGKFSLYFGVISSMVQVLFNFTMLIIKKRLIEFDLLPLMLSFGQLIAAWFNRGERSVIRCGTHGESVVQCPQCEHEQSSHA